MESALFMTEGKLKRVIGKMLFKKIYLFKNFFNLFFIKG